MLTYADVCRVVARPSDLMRRVQVRMLTYADVCVQGEGEDAEENLEGLEILCSRMLTYAHVCSRMLTYAHVCVRGEGEDAEENLEGLACAPLNVC